MTALMVPTVTNYLFVDGGCVRAELAALSRKYYGELGRARLAWSSFQHSYTKIFYYDALPAREANEDDRVYEERNAEILELHMELRALNGFHVYEGDVRRARSRKERPQQKKVDVMIAVDMLLHTFRRNMHSATLIASDLDFAPLLQALVREGMFVTLWYPPLATTEELRAAADSRRELTTSELGTALITDTGLAFLPHWQSGILHFNQYAHLNRQSWNTADGWSVNLTGADHFMVEVYHPNGHPVAYAPHHDARTLLLATEERHSITLPDNAFDHLGGRPA